MVIEWLAGKWKIIRVGMTATGWKFFLKHAEEEDCFKVNHPED